MSRLIPELSMESGRPSRSDPDEARFRLFDGIATMLKESARSKPLFLVLDDLHDADQASLETLKFVARRLSIACISVVGTFREGAINRSATVGSIIGELMREGHQLPLRGLNEAEIADYLEDQTGLAVNEKLVTALHQATGGNPLFLDGVVRLLLAAEKLAHPDTIDVSDLAVPDGARSAIRAQIKYLSEEAQSLLGVASVAGNEFEVGLLQSVAAAGEKEVLDLLDEAVAAKITSLIPGSRTRYRFAHGLVRTAIYDALGSAKRTLLHWQIGEKLEDVYSSDLDSHLAELAHHFVEAIPSFNPDNRLFNPSRPGSIRGSRLRGRGISLARGVGTNAGLR
jgi:predicted ATPase